MPEDVPNPVPKCGSEDLAPEIQSNDPENERLVYDDELGKLANRDFSQRFWH